MNQIDPPLQFNMDLLGLVVAVAVFAAIFALVRRAPGSYRLLIAAALVMGVLLLVMIGYQSKRAVISPPTVVLRESLLPTISPPKVEPESPKPDLPSEASLKDSSSHVTALPDWTQQPTNTAAATTLAVVRSGRFASREEAEQHAIDEAISVAANHFRRLDPRDIASYSDTQRELVRQTAIRQRFDEVSRHDFGTMKNHPMHQVWLQLELSPTLGDKLAEPWRHSAVEARLRTLTGWAIWLTAAAATLTIALRLDSAWHGQRRRAVCFVTVFLVVSSLALIA